MAGKQGGASGNEEYIYRISTAEEWEKLQSTGGTLGNDHDKSTGYVHLSMLHQVQHTLKNFFSNCTSDLYLLQIDAKKLGDGLIYEDLNGGPDVFPHFYGPARSYSPLPLDSVKKAERLIPSGGQYVCSLLNLKPSFLPASFI